MKELFIYLWKNKMWWLIPPVTILVVLGSLVVAGTASPVSPFIYMLF